MKECERQPEASHNSSSWDLDGSAPLGDKRNGVKHSPSLAKKNLCLINTVIIIN